MHVPINGIGTHISKVPTQTHTWKLHYWALPPLKKKMCVSGLKPDIMVDIGDGAKAIKSGKPKPSALNPKL